MSHPKNNATVEVNGSEILIRIQAPASEGGDRLIWLEHATCKREGFEVGGLRAKVEAGELPVVTLGRRRYVRMSDLLRLPKTVSKKPDAPASDYDIAVSEVRKKRVR